MANTLVFESPKEMEHCGDYECKHKKCDYSRKYNLQLAGRSDNYCEHNEGLGFGFVGGLIIGSNID